MTRINVVEPSELTNKHLMAELHEITRVYGLVRKAQNRKINEYNFKDKIKQPSAYTMGTGHVYFMYDKLGFITKRYYALNIEAKNRGFKVNPIDQEQLISGIQQWWFGDYIPTQEALEINRKRISETTMNREEYIESLREEIAKRDMQIVELKGALKEVLATHDYHADDGSEAAERAYEVLYPSKED